MRGDAVHLERGADHEGGVLEDLWRAMFAQALVAAGNNRKRRLLVVEKPTIQPKKSEPNSGISAMRENERRWMSHTGWDRQTQQIFLELSSLTGPEPTSLFILSAAKASEGPF